MKPITTSIYLTVISTLFIFNGCEPDDSSTDTMAGTDTMVSVPIMAGTDTMAGADCQGYCEYLEECNSCLQDEMGNCVDLPTCSEICTTEVPATAATCISDLMMCDEDAFTACYDQTIGDDDCARTCVLLEECGECFTDDLGECLSLAACTQTCREVTPPAAAACLGATSVCEEIDACFE